MESLTQSVSNTRTSESLAAHEWDLGIKHNPLGLRRGLCFGEPKEVNIVKKSVISKGKDKVCVAHQTGGYPGFCSDSITLV